MCDSDVLTQSGSPAKDQQTTPSVTKGGGGEQKPAS